MKRAAPFFLAGNTLSKVSLMVIVHVSTGLFCVSTGLFGVSVGLFFESAILKSQLFCHCISQLSCHCKLSSELTFQNFEF